MIQYGLISRTDAGVIEKTLDLIVQEGQSFPIRITEIGLYNCQTSAGIYQYLQEEKNLLAEEIIYIGVDSEKDKLINPPIWMEFIRGLSGEVYHKIPDNSQDFIFIDGCHCFAHVVSDFFCYAPKVAVGGYLAFHDTGKHIKPFKDFQHGDKSNPDAYISCRKALNEIGVLMDDSPVIRAIIEEQELSQWQCVFDEADETNEAGGVCVFKKIG